MALIRVALVAVLWLAGSSVSRQDNIEFRDVTGLSGIDFVHENGASPEKYLPETMGSGAVIFDYDNDGWSDLFFVNGGTFAEEDVRGSARHRLYRNITGETREMRFRDVTESAGIHPSRFGMGACSADYDNDGWEDLYVTSVAANTLYKNSGGVRFVDVTREAGVAAESWSSSCAFADVDNDGDVDLYVTRYLDFSPDNNKYCGDIQNVRFYCHPNIYNGVADILYRNNGNGTFSDVSREAGVFSTEGKGLGVVFTDYDGDGWIDIYVANDSTPNFLFHNRGDGRFEEAGLWSGVAVGLDGKPLAGMGTDAGDVDGDGMVDLIVTNLDRQTHNLYRNLGGGLFADVTYESGVGEATLPYVGFGAAFFDYDNDRDLDLAIVNGDVLDNISLLRHDATYAQRNLLLRNDGTGRFEEVADMSASGFAARKVSRALAVGDLDNDGDIDVLITNSGQKPDLLRNDGGNRLNSLQVRLAGVRSNRDGIGARLKLHVGGEVLVRDVVAGSGYLGQNERRVHFGMGDAQVADRLEIIWPAGAVDVLEDLRAGQLVTVSEGGSIVSTVDFRDQESRAVISVRPPSSGPLR